VPAGQYVAAVRDVPSDIARFSRIAFEARASRPMRMSVQLRDASGGRWLRSEYVGPEDQTITATFADLRAADLASPPHPGVGTPQALILAIDLTNASPSATGSIWLSDLRFER
jgi:hypothetical protein